MTHPALYSEQNLDTLPNFDDLARVAAAHAVEVALSNTREPEEVLPTAIAYYKWLRGEAEEWPARRILH